MKTETAAQVVKPGQAPAHWVLADRVSLLATSQDTDSAYTMMEVIVQPGSGPPPHVHQREHELFYILEGTVSLLMGEHVSTAWAGEAVFLPRGVVHTYRNIGTTPARMLVVALPGGFEQFVADAGEPCDDPSAPPPPVDDRAIQKLTRAASKHGLELRPSWKAVQPAPPRSPAKEWWVVGQHVKVLLDSDDTRSRFTVSEVTTAPGEGVPPHVHVREDEMFYVLSGTFDFTIGQEQLTAPAGTFVRVPSGTMHGFRNVGVTPARLVDYHTPGGFEKFYASAGIACADYSEGAPPGLPDMEQFARTCREHGMEIPIPVEA